MHRNFVILTLISIFTPIPTNGAILDNLMGRLNGGMTKTEVGRRIIKGLNDSSQIFSKEITKLKYEAKYQSLFTIPTQDKVNQMEMPQVIEPVRFDSKRNCYIFELRPEAPDDVRFLLNEVIQVTNGNVKCIYKKTIDGIGMCLKNEGIPLELFGQIPWIKSIEPDQKFNHAQIQYNSGWGLSHLNMKLKSYVDKPHPYGFNHTGKNVDAYFIDSLICVDHEEFNGRAKNIYSLNNVKNCDAHATSVASIAGGLNIGVAKELNIYGVNVFDDNGDGYTTDLLDALEFILKQPHKNSTIINMSLGGPPSPTLNAVISSAVKRCITVIAAAGNNNSSADDYSPSSSSDVITVGAMNLAMKRSTFSNYGPSLDIFAPGEKVYCANNVGYREVNGTSFAAPYITGIAALLYEQYPKITNEKIREILTKYAIPDLLDSKTLKDSPNRLAQIPVDDLDALIRNDKIITLNEANHKMSSSAISFSSFVKQQIIYMSLVSFVFLLI